MQGTNVSIKWEWYDENYAVYSLTINTTAIIQPTIEVSNYDVNES